MCFVKCGDLSPNLARDEIWFLSWNKNPIDYRIRKLIKENFIWKEKYLALKSKWLDDEEIIKQISIEAELAWLSEELDILINSGKEKIDSLLEL